MRLKISLIISIFCLLFFLISPIAGQVQRFKGSGQLPSKIVEVPDDQMNEFLDRLDARFDQKYRDLISKIRLAWNSRDIRSYDATFRALILKIKNDVFGKEGPQPTGGCERYFGWYICYCGTAVTCCCVFACNSVPINICMGVDMGGVIGGGGGGGGRDFRICRPIGFTKR